jgi:outer membrane immunogenic protein
VDWESTFRGRVGYAFDRFLVYGTGGLAVAGVGDATNSTEVGLALGAGADIAFTDNLFGRVEYQYANYGSTPFHDNLSTHEVRIGLGVKF